MIMNRAIRLLLSFGFFLVVSGISSGVDATGENITRRVISGGSFRGSSPSFMVKGLAGEFVSGIGSSPSYEIDQGYRPDFLLPVPAAIVVTPRTFNLKSRGRWISGDIELPIEYSAESISIETVRLQEAIPAESSRWEIGDVNNNGIDELTVKFDRALFQSILPQGEYVPITITGAVGTRMFLGEDTIRTIRPTVLFPKGGEILSPGETITVIWRSPEGYSIDSADVYWTPDDGETWHYISTSIPDTGSMPWVTPASYSYPCRIMVTIYSNGMDLGMGMSQNVFAISEQVSVMVEDFRGTVDGGVAVLEWTALSDSRVEGFRILRSEGEKDIYVSITDELIPADGSRGKNEYKYIDASVCANKLYLYKLAVISSDGTTYTYGPCKLTVVSVYNLEQNRPNPFNPTTTIRYSLQKKGHVRIMIYNVNGQLIRTLVDGVKEAGVTHHAIWDGRNDRGSSVSSGIYFYRLVSGKFKATRKMVLLR